MPLPHLALLTSPLLGRSVWETVAHGLTGHGWQVTVVAHEGPAPTTSDDVMSAFLEQLSSKNEWVLVPHSNAGLFVPGIAAQRLVRAAVYVDSRLPQAAMRFPMSSPESLAFLSSLVDNDDMLPPWSQWWGESISTLFPTRESRERAAAEMRRLPLRYFLDDVTGMEELRVPAAYLAFGDTYAQERATAESDGWPVATLPGDHLLMMIRPGDVATKVQLARSLLGP